MVVNNAHWKDKLRKGEAVSGSQVLIDVSEIHGMSMYQIRIEALSSLLSFSWDIKFS
jgi:hypothetical protein